MSLCHHYCAQHIITINVTQFAQTLAEGCNILGISLLLCRADINMALDVTAGRFTEPSPLIVSYLGASSVLAATFLRSVEAQVLQQDNSSIRG